MTTTVCSPASASEALDTRVAVHEISHYLLDRLNGSDRIVQVSVSPTDTWEGICYGERRQAFANGGRDASEVRELLQPVMPLPGESHTPTADVVQSVLDACVELLAGEVGERLVLGDAKPALDDRRQTRKLARLIAKSEAGVDRFIAFCEQQAADMLAPHALIIHYVAADYPSHASRYDWRGVGSGACDRACSV